MNTGIPGTGIATLWYLACVLAMPFVELIKVIRGRSGPQRWAVIRRHVTIALAVIATWYLMFAYLPTARIPHGPLNQHVPALRITVVLLLAYIVVLPRLAPAQLTAAAVLVAALMITAFGLS